MSPILRGKLCDPIKCYIFKKKRYISNMEGELVFRWVIPAYERG